MKILIVKLRAVGDVVLSTAVIPNLRQAFPKADIDFLVDHAAFGAVQGHPNLRYIHVLPPAKKRLFGKSRSLRQQISLIRNLNRQKYDIVFDLYGNPRSALLTWMTRAPVRVGFDFRGRRWLYTRRIPPRGDFLHEVEFNLDALRGLGIPIVEKKLTFPLFDEDLVYIDNWFEHNGMSASTRVALHVWGGWPAKRWGLDRFAQLADRLIESLGVKVILLWGPGEEEVVELVMQKMKHSAALAPETTLKQLGALIHRCHLVIANDSGPMHISAALNTPTVGIYGPTKARLQGPYGHGHRVALKTDLECLGCNKQECPTMVCMNTLTVEEVWDVIVECISGCEWDGQSEDEDHQNQAQKQKLGDRKQRINPARNAKNS